ncbi:MAG: hypothetical protein HC908_03810 [Calothrix sp. SM1_7_51]|nr:hypothetical protein [Calothrix sp. SM1_7_51]
MNFNLLSQAILLSVCIITLMLILLADRKKQKSLQWWSARQSLKLFLEAEKIRDDMLQESFTIRRSLELLPADNREPSELSLKTTQNCLKAIDSFHQSLSTLSDRLFPPYLQDSLPLAIQTLLLPWITSQPQVYFQIEIPSYWRHEPAERSFIVLRSLEELLRIILPELQEQASVYIAFKTRAKFGQLIVQFTYPDIDTEIYYSNIKDLQHLCESFKFLTSGKCFIRIKHNKIIWSFWW